MKKSSICIIVVACIFVGLSCKKTDISITDANNSLLRHKWTWNSETLTIPAYPQGNSHSVFTDGSYSEFRTDGKVYNLINNNADTAYYTVTNNKIAFSLIYNGQRSDSSNATIVSLTSTRLVLSIPNIYYVDNNGVETIYTGEVIDSLSR